MHIKNVVFDFGGVLIDWNPRYLYQEFFDDSDQMEWFLSNICTQEWNVQQDAGRTIKEATETLVKRYPEYESLILKYYEGFDTMMNDEIQSNTKLIPHIKKNGYGLYGLTNWSAETIQYATERFSFFKLLDGMVVSGVEKVIKPDKKIYQILLDRFKIQAGESLFIDDNIDNIHAASDLGFETIHYFGEGCDLKEQLRKFKVL